MPSPWAFVIVVLVVAAQRLFELRKSAENEARLFARGAREHAREQVRWMRLLHAAWFASMLVEVLAFDRKFQPGLAAAALVVFVAGQALRFSAMRALGERWTVRVITLPGVPAVASGIFRFVRHPNYLGVVLEVAALPLVHGAWITAVGFTVANALFLRARITVEEAALRGDSAYDEALGDRPRFVPARARS